MIIPCVDTRSKTDRKGEMSTSVTGKRNSQLCRSSTASKTALKHKGFVERGKGFGGKRKGLLVIDDATLDNP